jgi:Iap family predicted aminopeptidase
MHIFRRIFPSNYWWQESDISSQASKKPPLQYTYDYILEKIVRRFNCTLLYKLYDVLYVIILLYSILYWCILQLRKEKKEKNKQYNKDRENEEKKQTLEVCPYLLF